jgi:hypothetical protein
MKKRFHAISVILFLFLVAGSCKKASDPNDETEHEAINAIDLVFKQSGTTIATFTAEDPDGDGGNPPSRIDRITLKSGQTYSMETVLRNIVNGTSKVVNSSISSQSDHHELYYIPSGVNVAITKTDKDVNGYPVGFYSSWSATTAGTGTLLMKLMHKPRIKGPNDDPSKGHSDIEISFPISIQ